MEYVGEERQGSYSENGAGRRRQGRRAGDIWPEKQISSGPRTAQLASLAYLGQPSAVTGNMALRLAPKRCRNYEWRAVATASVRLSLGRRRRATRLFRDASHAGAALGLVML